MSKYYNKYRLIYGHGNDVYGHEYFKSPEEREAWASGFSSGALQYAGEEAFTLCVPEDINAEYIGEYYKGRLDSAYKYLNDLDAKEAYEDG